MITWASWTVLPEPLPVTRFTTNPTATTSQITVPSRSTAGLRSAPWRNLSLDMDDPLAAGLGTHLSWCLSALGGAS